MLQFIVIGKDPGSKLDDALCYGHILLSELDFLHLLNKNSNSVLDELTLTYKLYRDLRKESDATLSESDGRATDQADW